MPGRGETNRMPGDCLELTELPSMILVVLLMIGRIEHNSGPVVEV
jgi:hypothetical protein